MKLMKLTVIAAAMVISGSAFAVSAPPVASASIDWSTFSWQVFDTNPSDGVTAALTWNAQPSDVSTNVDNSYKNFNSSDWTSPISAVDGVASATVVSGGNLQATFSSLPTTLNANAWANHNGYFTLSANTLVTFSVMANTSIEMNSPINGSAYAWSGLDAYGPGPYGQANQNQTSSGSKISWASGLGNPVNDIGGINALFFNGTGSAMDGTIHAYANVTSYGFIPAVPEPDTYGMMLVGLCLVGSIAKRRKIV
jgi:hypothetical protein